MAAKKTSTKAATTSKATTGAKAKTPATVNSTAKAKTSSAKGAATGGSGKGGTGKKEKSLGELLDVLAEKTGLTRAKTKEFLDAQAALLTEELKQNASVVLSGIGKLKLGNRAARKGRNPQTGEEITIKASKTVKLSSGKAFKESFQ